MKQHIKTHRLERMTEREKAEYLPKSARIPAAGLESVANWAVSGSIRGTLRENTQCTNEKKYVKMDDDTVVYTRAIPEPAFNWIFLYRNVNNFDTFELTGLA